MENKPNNQSAQEVDKTICPTCGASLFEHQSKAGGYNKTDLERMYLLGLLNREGMDMNTLSKELEKARTKIDLAINFIQSLTPTPVQTKGREVCEYCGGENNTGNRFCRWECEAGASLPNSTTNPSNKGA